MQAISVPVNTIVGLSVFEPCNPNSISSLVDYCIPEAAQMVSVVEGAHPINLFLSKYILGGTANGPLLNGDLINLKSLCLRTNTPMLLTHRGSAVVWAPATTVDEAPKWRVVVSDRSVAQGAVVNVLQPVSLESVEFPAHYITKNISGNLQLAQAPSVAACIGYQALQLLFLPPHNINTEILPSWVVSWYPSYRTLFPQWWSMWTRFPPGGWQPWHGGGQHHSAWKLCPGYDHVIPASEPCNPSVNCPSGQTYCIASGRCQYLGTRCGGGGGGRPGMKWCAVTNEWIPDGRPCTLNPTVCAPSEEFCDFRRQCVPRGTCVAPNPMPGPMPQPVHPVFQFKTNRGNLLG